MRNTEIIPNTPVPFKRTNRPARGLTMTNGDAGKVLPVRMEPIEREASASGTVGMSLQMAETPEPIANAVHAKACTYFVPYLAFGQFDGSLERLNRSYAGENDIGDTSPLPFFEINKFFRHDTGVVQTSSYADTWDTNDSAFLSYSSAPIFYQTLGIHTEASNLNCSYVQAYNAVINHRRKARSPQFAVEGKIRNEFDHRLAECFWPNSGNSHIVADYDEKLIAGEVNLQGLTFKANIVANNIMDQYGGITVPGTPDSNQNYAPSMAGSDITHDGTEYILDEIWAELTSGGNATMNLADIELAKNLASFAKLRSAYSGRTDEWIIDMLMQGIEMPMEMLKDPLLVGQSSGVFNMAQRFASDAGNLDDSVTRGICNLNYRVNMPRTSVGGILVTTVEIAPEQIWERKKDYFLYTTSANQLPNALKDNLSILGGQHAVQVKKDHLDVNHSTPDAVLGFAPLNHEWRRDHINLGGKLYRPADDAYSQDRARVWSNEVTDPNLSTDAYLCTNLHKKVFSDQTSEAFEITAMQDLSVNTNIQFGDALIETDASSDYEAIETLVNG
jgi:hypothetical protein